MPAALVCRAFDTLLQIGTAWQQQRAAVCRRSAMGWRYSCHMHRFWTLLSLWLAASCVLAQPARDAGPRDDRQAAREQLRGELRGAALVARPRGESQLQPVDESEPEKPATSARQLTPRERAEMRQQLRQEQLDYRRIRP